MGRLQSSDAKAEFAKRLAALRVMAQYTTMRDFADALGYEEARYGRWERGEVEPGIEALCRIHEITNASLDFLVAGDRAGPMNIRINPNYQPPTTPRPRRSKSNSRSTT
jgi:transcriptional regulator with XRE-family HTH domain